MNEKKEHTDWSTWFSTYGLLTAGRILERFNIYLPHDELISSFKDSSSVYFQLLRVPLKNIFNGIIRQQAHDYQIYAQKLFVDYLLSGEDAKEKEAPGGETRDNVEMERVKLIERGQEFRKVEEAHQVLIAKSQAKLVELTRDLNALHRDPLVLLQSMADSVEQAEEINMNLRSYRSEFYNVILRVQELLRLMSDYHLDQEKLMENLMTLEFDAMLGEK